MSKVVEYGYADDYVFTTQQHQRRYLRMQKALVLCGVILLLVEVSVFRKWKSRASPRHVQARKEPGWAFGFKLDDYTATAAKSAMYYGSTGPGKHSEFNWTDVDLSVKLNCGWHKCFSKSVSNTSIGYLFASIRNYRQMKDSVDVALELEHRYGSKHFHVDLVKDTVTDEFRHRLNSLVEQPARRARGLAVSDVFDSPRLVVETVVIAPEPNLFFASRAANKKLLKTQMAEFREIIPDKEAFRDQMEIEYQRLKKVLRGRPTLVLDFQVLIDPQGNLYHIDLDGHLTMTKHANPEDLPKQIRKLRTMFRHVVSNLTEPLGDDGVMSI